MLLIRTRFLIGTWFMYVLKRHSNDHLRWKRVAWAGVELCGMDGGHACRCRRRGFGLRFEGMIRQAVCPQWGNRAPFTETPQLNRLRRSMASCAPRSVNIRTLGCDRGILLFSWGTQQVLEHDPRHYWHPSCDAIGEMLGRSSAGVSRVQEPSNIGVIPAGMCASAHVLLLVKHQCCWFEPSSWLAPDSCMF